MAVTEKTIIKYPMKEHYPMGFGLCFAYVMCDTTLSVQARCVFSLLSTFVNWSSGENTCFPERETIYSNLKISRALLSGYYKELKDHDLLKIEQRNKEGSVLHDSNIYTLNLKPSGFRPNPSASIVSNDIKEYGYGLASKELLLDKTLSLHAKALYLYIMAVAGQIPDYCLSLNKALRDLDIKESSFNHYKAELGKGYLKLKKCRELRIRGELISAKEIPDTYYRIELLSRSDSCRNNNMADAYICNDSAMDEKYCNNSNMENEKNCSDNTIEPANNCKNNAMACSNMVQSNIAESTNNNNISNINIINNNVSQSIPARDGQDGLTYDEILKIKEETGLLPESVINNVTSRINLANGLFKDIRYFNQGDSNIINMIKNSFIDLLSPHSKAVYDKIPQPPQLILMYVNDVFDNFCDVVQLTRDSYIKELDEGRIKSDNHNAYIKTVLISKLRSGTNDIEKDIHRDFGDFSDEKSSYGKELKKRGII